MRPQSPPPERPGAGGPGRPPFPRPSVSTGMDQQALASVWVGVWRAAFVRQGDAKVADMIAEAATRRFRELLTSPARKDEE